MIDLASQLLDAIQGVIGDNPDAAGPLASGAVDETGHTKAEANYRGADSEELCGNCLHFEHDCCNLVAGRISADCVCDLWEVGPEAHSPHIKVKMKIPGHDMKVGA